MCSFSSIPLVLVTILSVLSHISAQSSSLSPSFSCSNGQISVTPCKKSFFGGAHCDNKTLVCEQKLFCCPPTVTTRAVTGSTSSGSPSSSSSSPHSQNITGSTISSSANSNCDKCDVTVRLTCFRSLHVNITSTTPSQDCAVCENCCNDAFPHKCEVWKHQDFCDLEWYSMDKKRILCGKTCGIC